MVTIISASVSFGYALAGMRRATPEQKTASSYAFARSLALLVVAVIAIVTGSVPFVAAITIAMVIVQAADAVVGVSIRDRVKTIGPAVTAVVGLATLVWMLLSSA